MLTDEVKNAFKIPEKGKLLIITTGNTLRADDGVGPYIGEAITIDHPRLAVLNTGNRPEDALDTAVEIRPSRCLVIDAAAFDGDFGEARLIPEDLIPDTTLSTHTFPLKVITRMIQTDSGADIQFLGIQPREVSLGKGLSEEVKKTADEIIQLINTGDVYA